MDTQKPKYIPPKVWAAAIDAFDTAPADQGHYETIARAIMAAEVAEREACAQLVLDHGHGNGNIRPVNKHLASAIRQRA